jgi:hypothetical protein
MTQISYLTLDDTSLRIDTPVTGAGLGGSSSLPPECAAVLTLRTGKRGRRYRGRIYLPAPGIAGVTNATGTLPSTIISGTTAQWAGMQAALVSKQWVPVVASYGQSMHKVPNTHPPQYVPVTWTPFVTAITNATMDANIDVQRRRKM